MHVFRVGGGGQRRVTAFKAIVIHGFLGKQGYPFIICFVLE